MSDAAEIAPEIAILLAQTWQSQDSEEIGQDVICRIWAFDFGWFDMGTALRVRDNLIQAGWLDATGEMVQAGIDLADKWNTWLDAQLNHANCSKTISRNRYRR